MTQLEILRPDGTEPLVDRIVVIIWAKQVFSEYAECNGLPIQNSKERKHANNLITQTAGELLKNPQDITIAQKTWRGNELSRDGAEKPQEPFSKLVKEKMLTLIKDKWDDVKPEQLAQLIQIYANKDDSQKSAREFAELMLTKYFKSPKNRNQRINAYYNFVSGVLDLAEEDEAFKEGMKIALHATDILPKNPSFGEQLNLLSLPSKAEETGGVFQKLLTIESVTKQAIFMSSQDFTEYFRDNEYFMRTDVDVKKGWRERKKRVTRELGSPDVAEAKNNAVRAAMSVFFNFLTEPLSEERKQSLKDTWPFDLAFDENDPLNQKFERVFSDQLSHSSQVPS